MGRYCVQKSIFIVCCLLCVGDFMGCQATTTLEKVNEMECYQCNTSDDGNDCRNLTDPEVSINLRSKCKGDRRTCKVKTYSYVVTGIRNATNTPKLWFMERSCVNKCENGCIVIGERTKLFSCISCCSVPLCNVMDKCSKIITYNVLYYIVLVSLIFFSHNAFI